MLNNFIYSETKGLFLEQLDQKNIPEEAIAFLEDSGEIGNRNHYFGSVGVNNLLTEGKLIGTITANNNPYNIYAPKTYNWSEITSKPTNLGGYGITDAVRYNSAIDISGENLPLNEVGYGFGAQGWYTNGPAMTFGYSQGFWMQMQLHYAYGLNYRQSNNGAVSDWVRVLDSKNYASFLDNAYLKRSGGTITGDVYFSDSFIYLGMGKTGKSRISNMYGDEEVNALAFTLTGLYLKSPHLVYVDTTGTNYDLLHEGNYESIVGDKFLKLSGGTIKSLGTDISLVLDSDRTANASWISYKSNGVLLGSLGFNGVNTPSFYEAGGTSRALLHEGNYGSVLNDAYFRVFSGGTYNANTISAGGMYRVEAQYEGGESWPIPPAYGNAIHVKVPLSDTAFQIAAPQYSTQRLFFRSFANSTQATQTWKEFAFTDSNVASATKLQTARSLWGNTFDGTVDVNTRLTFNANDATLAAWKKDGSSFSLFLQVNPDRHVLIGQGTARENGGLYLYGNDIRMCYGNAGSSNNTAMLINSSGNVTIGASDKAGGTYRLLIDEATHVQKVVDHGTLGSPSKSFSIGSKQYGLDVWVKNDGSSNIQSHRFDGTVTAYALNLQPLGGIVNIGGRLRVNGATDNESYDFSVNGTGYFSGKVQGASGFSTASANGYGFHSESAWYGMTPIMIGENNGVKLAGFGGIEVRIFQGYSMFPTLNAVNDLGTASNCWRSIFASKSVKIGDATLSWDADAQALKINTNVYSDGKVSSGGIEIDPATISTQISQLTATIEGLQSTVKLLQDELNSLK